VPIARRAQNGSPPRGRWWNAFESLLTFIRNEVARPNLGQDAERFLPFLWTMFLFILFCNLLGMVPVLGSPTASPWMTGGLALIAFTVIHGAAILKQARMSGDGHNHHDHGHGHDHHGHDHHGHEQATGAAANTAPLTLNTIATVGLVRYLKSLWPHIEVPVIGPILSGAIWAIELFGTVIKCGVLAIRLYANMFAGHMVLATILLFVVTTGELVKEGTMGVPLWSLITVFSVGGVVALSLLELFVAFLQAYVFVFLTALFMGMALNPEH
jgi:F-type H+-transporting ATPase subunit a